MDELITEVLEASLANPNDDYEVDLVADVASVGVTKELFRGGKKIDWIEEVLAATASSLEGMPVNLKFKEDDDSIEPHSNVVIGRISDVSYDKSRQKVLAKGKLWKHYFPETMEKLTKRFKDGKMQTSIEFMPTKAEYPEEGVIRPLDGRFIGLGIVDEGADTGNFVHLFASAKKEEQKMKLDESRKKGLYPVGSYEWIGEQLITHLNASASTEDYEGKDIVATYNDRAVWLENGTYYQIPYTIDRTSISFGDTIEVEHDFKPIVAGTKSEETPTVEPHKEAETPMAEINDTELAALKASAAKTPDLEKELEELKASAAKLEGDLKEANEKLTAAEKREEEQKLEKLAASRMEQVEKITKYDDQKLREEDLETFKTMDEKAFGVVLRSLQAAADAAQSKGGVSDPDPIRNPFETTQDPDGEAKKLIESPDFKALVASVSAKKENE